MQTYGYLGYIKHTGRAFTVCNTLIPLSLLDFGSLLAEEQTGRVFLSSNIAFSWVYH